MSTQELYLLLATLANTANDQPWFAPDVLHALMTVYSQDEEALAKVYTVFTKFRFLAISGFFQMKCDHIYSMLDIGTPAPVMPPHYKLGEYCIVDNKELVVDPSGNADLLQRYEEFVLDQFNHAPLGLNAEQHEEVSAIENEAFQKYTIRGSPTMISQPYTRLDLIIHTLYETDALSLQLYPLLAALAIVSKTHPSSAPDILYALMTVFRNDEQRLAMIYHMFAHFRFDSMFAAMKTYTL